MQGGALQGHARGGRVAQGGVHVQENVHDTHQSALGSGSGLADIAFRGLLRQVHGGGELIRDRPGNQEQPHMSGKLPGENGGLMAGVHQFVHAAECRGRVLVDQGLGKAEEEAPVAGAQHVAHQGLIHILSVADAHVKDGQGVAHAALGRPGDLHQRIVGGFHALLVHGLPQASHDQPGRDTAEVVPLAAAQDGGGHLVGLGGGEDEDHVGRGLLEGLQQGVEGAGGEHVHLVDDEDLEPPVLGRVLHGLQDPAHIVDPGIGSRVVFENVETGFALEAAAALALAAGVTVGGVFTVRGPGQDLGGGSLAGAPAAAEEVGVGQPPRSHLVAQGVDHQLLPHHGGKIQGPPLPVQDLMLRHGARSFLRNRSGFFPGKVQLVREAGGLVRADAAHRVKILGVVIAAVGQAFRDHPVREAFADPAQQGQLFDLIGIDVHGAVGTRHGDDRRRCDP